MARGESKCIIIGGQLLRRVTGRVHSVQSEWECGYTSKHNSRRGRSNGECVNQVRRRNKMHTSIYKLLSDIAVYGKSSAYLSG